MEERARGRYAVIIAGILLVMGALVVEGATMDGQAGGDPRHGEALFVGTRSFEKGGAPCLGCHGIAGAGLGKAAGASYGPDLTGIYESYGEEGVASILESLPFTSMQAIYAERPLTPGEQTDLAAFLREVSGREPPRVAGSLLAEAAAGVGVLLLVLALFNRRTLRPVRRSLLEDSVMYREEK